jgi:hypothetical protein
MTNLFSDEEDFRKYISVDVGFNHEDVADDIETALQKYIFPYCSIEQFNASKLTSTAWDGELIERIKSAAAHLGLYLFMPLAKVNIKAGGGIEYNVDRAKQASPEDKEDLANSFFVKGMAKVEDMLLFLERTETANAPAKFQAWKASAAYTQHTARLIRNTTEYKIIDSRQVFLKLLPFMEDVEFDVIERAVPATTLAKLYSRDFGNDTDVKKAYETLLYKYVQPIVRSEALYRGLDQMAVLVDRYNTLTVHDDTSANKTKGSKEASIDKIERKKEGLKKLYLDRLGEMTAFIFRNADLLDYEVPADTEEVVGPYKNKAEHGSVLFGTFSR